jgi:hypothetical protein
MALLLVPVLLLSVQDERCRSSSWSEIKYIIVHLHNI